MKTQSATTAPASIAAVALPRRKAIASIAAALGGMAAGRRAFAQTPQSETAPEPGAATTQTRTALHYDLEFEASPQRLYDALLDAKQFAAFSGLPAAIDRTEGGAFALFGGQIVGRNVELVAHQRIVQAWRPTHWDAGIYSIARFVLRSRGAGSTMSFDHTGFPAGEFTSLDWGWHHHYWEPLTRFLA